MTNQNADINDMILFKTENGLRWLTHKLVHIFVLMRIGNMCRQRVCIRRMCRRVCYFECSDIIVLKFMSVFSKFEQPRQRSDRVRQNTQITSE